MADDASPGEDRLHVGEVRLASRRRGWPVEARRIGLAVLVVDEIRVIAAQPLRSRIKKNRDVFLIVIGNSSGSMLPGRQPECRRAPAKLEGYPFHDPLRQPSGAGKVLARRLFRAPAAPAAGVVLVAKPTVRAGAKRWPLAGQGRDARRVSCVYLLIHLEHAQ